MSDMDNSIHLKAPDCWLNDPNGFIFYKGEYHLFYQCFPYAPHWGRMHWGHAVSRDLTNWEHKGIALYPSKADDRSGCFSGSAIEHDGKMYIFYTGVNYAEEDPENINVSLNDEFSSAQLMITSGDGYSFDNLNDKKLVIPSIEAPETGCKKNTRDPKVWRGKNAWYMVLGSTVDQCGRMLFYRSYDLKGWEYINFCEKENFGWMWECPDYFETDGFQVAVFSPMGFLNDGKAYDSAAICMLASFDEESCSMRLPDEYQFFDYGLDLYAPQSTSDENGKRVVIAWARMPEAVNGRWNGMFCIPRIVEVKDGHIYFRPHPNVKKRFSEKITSVSEAGSSGYQIRMELRNGESINIGGYVISREADKLLTDRSAVFAGHNEIRCRFETPFIKEGFYLEIYVDSNLIEIYINNGEYVLSNVVYGLSDKIDGKDYELYTTAD